MRLLSRENPAVFAEMECSQFETLTEFDLIDTITGPLGQKRKILAHNRD